MSGVRLEPPASAPPPTHPPPEKRGSLASGIGLAWLVVLVGEGLIFGMVPFLRSATAFLLPPLAVAAWAVVLLCGDKPRTGVGMLLGLLSIAAVLLLLVAACFGLLGNMHLGNMH
jgi:hypothetical protein